MRAGAARGRGGVSSFGYSGTIAHALLQGASRAAAVGEGGGAPLRYRRRAFLWSEPAHPLLQRRLPAPSGCAALFRSPVAGPLHALVADHIVRGRILFPGVAYLETARAACSAAAPPSAAGAALRGVFFLQPLALEAGGAAWVECVLLESGAFEVRSGSGEAVAVVHCSGQWAAAEAAAWRPLGLAAARERCDGAADTSALYAALCSAGLQYGPAYRALEAAWQGAGEATARLRLRRRASLAGTQVHPADLDGALHSTALLRRGGGGEAETRLPFAMDGVLMRGPAAGVLWAVASASGADAADVALGGGDGVAYAQLDGYHARKLRAYAESHQEHLYETVWRDAGASAGAQPASGGAIAVVGALQRAAWHGGSAARAASIASIVVADLHASLLPLPALAAMLRLASAHGGSAMPRVWLVSAPPGIAGAGVQGLARAARAEAPSLPLGCVALRGSLCDSVGAIAQMLPQSEPELAGAAAGRSWRVPRLSSSRLLRGGARLDLQARGAISNLRLEQQPAFEAPSHAGEVELRVHAVGLNFRDVLNVLGQYPGDPGPPGSDCAGVIADVGGGAGRLRPGGAVLGFAHAPLGLRARADARLLAPKPAALSFEAACTLPTVWSTVHVAFGRARLRAGQRVLLQAAAGGVGLVGVTYAHWLRVNVSGTAGRPQKHRPLRLQRVGRLCSSRDAGAFSCGAARAHCGGRLRLVLNSLSGDFVAVSAALLGEGGALMEIGKRGAWSSERAGASAGACSFEALALDAQTEREPSWMQGVLGELSRRLGYGAVQPLPLQAFDLEQQWEAAFRLLQSGGNFGKVVIRISAPAGEASAGGQLLTGGTGGLGLLTARWLAASRGAPALVLASRSGALARGAAAEWALLDASGAAVRIARCDAADPVAVRRLLASAEGAARLRGVWHAAGVISDALLPRQTAATLARVYGPKAHGAWALQRGTAALPLEACALFSSVAALLGGMGQVGAHIGSSRHLDRLDSSS